MQGLKVLVSVCWLAVAAAAHAQFQFTTVDNPLGVSTQIIGVSGTTALGYYTDSSSNPHYFLYSGTTFTPLALNPPGSVGWVSATAISGTNILGNYLVNEPAGEQPAGYILSGTTYTLIQSPIGNRGTDAFGLSGGHVVGFAVYDKNIGFFYDGATYHQVLLNSNDYDTIFYPAGVDGSNVVGGYANGRDGFLLDQGGGFGFFNDPQGTYTTLNGISGDLSVGLSSARSFVLASGTYITVAAPGNPFETYVTSISGSTIAGYYSDFSDSTVTHGFIATITAPLGENADITLSTVTNPGNKPDTNGRGKVDYDYSVSTDDITVSQYCAFLNAVAATDQYGLYNPALSYPEVTTNRAGILRLGTAGSYSYLVTGSGNYPVTYVTWLDAARFCNWLQNGQPTTGSEDATTTEEGAYTLDGDVSHGDETADAGATWRLPTADEWYKAAFYDPAVKSGTGGYWLYATRSSFQPENLLTGPISSLIVSGSNDANYFDGTNYAESFPGYQGNSLNYLSPVEAYAYSASAYGTFDQNGDVYQWLDAEVTGTGRAVAGGSWRDGVASLQSPSTITGTAAGEASDNLGFRVVNGIRAVTDTGAYTLLLTSTDASAPMGTGYATLKVAYNTKKNFYSAALAGKLGDGESFHISRNLTTGAGGDELLVSSSLAYPSPITKGAKGSLAGVLQFTGAPGAELSGTLVWTKPAQARGAYPEPFNVRIVATGSIFAPSVHGSVILPGLTSGQLILSDTGTLSSSGSGTLTQAVTLNAKNQLVVNPPAAQKLRVTSLSKTTGLFKGTFLYPGAKPKQVEFSGMLFQDTSTGGGYFLGPNGSGKLALTPQTITVNAR